MNTNTIAQPTFTVDIKALKVCLEVYASHKPNPSNVREAEAYMAQCKGDPQFPNILLKVFEDASEKDMVRLVAFIQFKNLVKETWRIRRGPRPTSLYSEEFKGQVRSFLVKCLDVYKEKLIRKQLNDTLKQVCLTDFPVHYKELVDYFLKSIKNLNDALKDENTIMGKETIEALTTLKIILTEKSPRRVGDMDAIFNEVFFKFLGGFHDFWDYFHANIETAIGSSMQSQNTDQVSHFLRLARKADKVYIACLSNGCDSMIENQTVMQVTGLIVQRLLQLVKIVEALDGKKIDEDIYNGVTKNLYKLLLGVSQLQVAFPLLFKDYLIDYILVLEHVISNANAFHNDYVLKAAVICLTSVVKCYLYYSDDVYLIQKRKAGNYSEYQKEVFTKFHTHFSPEKIETIFQLFLVHLLPKRNFMADIENLDNFEELIETEEEQHVEDYDKLENSIYRLTLNCAAGFLLQFPTIAIPIIHTFCLKVVKNEVQLPSSAIQDGLFSIVGLLPMVYRKKGVDPSQYLDFVAILRYLENQAKVDINLAKRLPVLIHKWLDLFSLEVKEEVIKLVVDVTKSLDNYLIRYECCMCLKTALESDVKMSLDYVAISEHLVPVIVDILHKFQNPAIVWGIIGLLRLLFTKAQYTTQNADIIRLIQNLGVESLIKSDYEPLLNAVADMLKSIIASFPAGTVLPPIYQLCLELLDYQLSQGKVKLYLLSLWLFVAKEYTPEQQCGLKMKEMFAKYFTLLLSSNAPFDIAMTLSLIEEYLLAELIPSSDYENILKVIEDIYKKAIPVEKPKEELIEVKASLLSLLSTFLLIFLQSKDTNVAVFENIIVFLLQDLFRNYEGPQTKAFRVFKSCNLTIINRFLLLNMGVVFDILSRFKINFYEFLGHWVGNMNNASSKPAMRLNTLAILQVLPYIEDTQALLNSLKVFLKHTIPEVEDFIDSGSKSLQHQPIYLTGVSDRLKDTRDSDRKKASRQSSLYLEEDLKGAFTKVFKEAITKHQIGLEELHAYVQDEGLVKRFLQLVA